MPVRSSILSAAAVFPFILTACGDSTSDTTVITTVVTTAGATDTSQPELTTSDASSTTDVNPTSDGTTAVEETSTGTDLPGTTGSEPQGCFNEGTVCPPAPPEATFCEYVTASCAAHGIEPFYCAIVDSLCDESRLPDECQVCFAMSNYCAQIGTDCDGLFTECLCAYQAFEGGE